VSIPVVLFVVALILAAVILIGIGLLWGHFG
jgi:hypothetical protein